jgi:hypothetical protein
MDDKKVQFLPFHAINAFMLPDYRIEVIKIVFDGLSQVNREKQNQFNRFVKLYVIIPGFRHSVQAPVQLKIKPFITTFEKKPELTALTLDIWTELHKDLREKVFGLLTERGWEVLPPDVDRTKLPGFLTTWPENEDFATINQAFNTKYPGEGHTENDVSLMVVWLAGRLPYESERKENKYE